MIAKLVTWYQEFKERRFLKQHGCKTRAQYERRFDPDYNVRATKVKEYYHGYPYLHCFENRNHQIYWWDLGFDSSREIVEWCEENCQGKFRFDCMRVIKYWDEWQVNEIGGGDYYFVAFKNELDAFNFMLRWA